MQHNTIQHYYQNLAKLHLHDGLSVSLDNRHHRNVNIFTKTLKDHLSKFSKTDRMPETELGN